MKVLLTATVQSHICQFHKPLVEMLHAHGCEVHVAARDNLAEKNGLKLDFVEQVFDVPFARSPKSPDNILAYQQLKRIIDKGNYDVVHCNTPMGGIVTRLAAREARKQGTKVFYTAHGFHFYKGAPKKNWMVYYPIEKYFAPLSDKIITINYEDYELAKAHFSCPAYHIHGAGVDENRYHELPQECRTACRAQFDLEKGEFIILCVGELLPNKNQMMVIQAVHQLVAQYPQIRLLLAGNGPQKDALESYIQEHGLTQNVRLLGYCTNLEEYQCAADLGVSCSIREGLGINMIEAMLSGNPVIATINRGHSELIQNGKNGFLVKIHDVNELANKIEQLIRTPKLRESMRQIGLTVAKAYTQENVKKELEQIYFEEY